MPYCSLGAVATARVAAASRKRRGLLAVAMRRWAAVSASCLLVAAVGSFPSASRAATALSPALFEEVSTGVALIKTYGCGGRAVGQGTGFLVGDSVVMTARHVLQGACKVRVRVNGETFAGKRWVYWSGGRASEEAADLGDGQARPCGYRWPSLQGQVVGAADRREPRNGGVSTREPAESQSRQDHRAWKGRWGSAARGQDAGCRGRERRASH